MNKVIWSEYDLISVQIYKDFRLSSKEDETHCKDIHRSPAGVQSDRLDSSPEEWDG